MFADQSALAALESFTGGGRCGPPSGAASLASLTRVVEDTTATPERRDALVWSLARAEERSAVGLLQEVAMQDSSSRMRKSAAWALFRAGKLDSLRETLHDEMDPNTLRWKRFLLREADNNTRPFDDRPVRVDPTKPFDVTMPLEVEGILEFRDANDEWHTLTTGPISNERMIGKLTPAVNARSFSSTLVLQKRIRNINGSGADHIEGYFLRGLARMVGHNVMRHQYLGSTIHTVYRSGTVGDTALGVVPDTGGTLFRAADTLISTRPNVPYPYPHAVRGTFHGFVFVNPILATEPDRSLDGLVQIVSPLDPTAGELVNGIFHGTFRGIPEDVDNDGTVELNGVEMFVNESGHVLAA